MRRHQTHREDPAPADAAPEVSVVRALFRYVATAPLLVR